MLELYGTRPQELQPPGQQQLLPNPRELLSKPRQLSRGLLPSLGACGQDKIRILRRHYHTETNGLIYVVDSNDRDEDALEQLIFHSRSSVA